MPHPPVGNHWRSVDAPTTGGATDSASASHADYTRCNKWPTNIPLPSQTERTSSRLHRSSTAFSPPRRRRGQASAAACSRTMRAPASSSGSAGASALSDFRPRSTTRRRIPCSTLPSSFPSPRSARASAQGTAGAARAAGRGGRLVGAPGSTAAARQTPHRSARLTRTARSPALGNSAA